MARLVPAQPRCDTPAEDAALLVLERALDDSFVVFQKRIADGLLVAHPERGLCLVVTVDAVCAYDADAESWSGAPDPREAGRAARGALAALAAVSQPSLPVVLCLASTPQPGGLALPGVAFAGQEERLPALVEAALAAGAPLGVAAIDSFIQARTPGATAYVPGEITAAQAKWRAAARAATEGQAPAPEFPAVPAPPPPATVPVASAVAPPVAPMAVAVLEPPVLASPLLAPLVVPPMAVPAPLADAAPAPVRLLPVVVTPTAVRVDDKTRPDLTEDDPLVMLLRQAVETVTGGKPIFVAGVQVSPMDTTGPDFLLPALLIAAAEDWAPVVTSRGGKGGFLIRLRTDREALLGYRVTGLDPATPFLLMLPVVDKVRRSLKKDEFNLDSAVLQFTRWLSTNRLDTEAVADIDVRVALSI